MTYKELIRRVQDYSGFSDRESEDSLRLIVETLSSRLEEDGRENFASQLPQELESVALGPQETDTFTSSDMYEELSQLENIDRSHVKRQLMAVWEALKDALSAGQLNELRSQLPKDMALDLH